MINVSFHQFVKNRQMAMVTVFILSAIVHEYVLLVAFRFCYPILLFMFSSFGSKYIRFICILIYFILVICCVLAATNPHEIGPGLSSRFEITAKIHDDDVDLYLPMVNSFGGYKSRIKML